jgi:ABC-type Fe3+ transport system permease subunit
MVKLRKAGAILLLAWLLAAGMMAMWWLGRRAMRRRKFTLASLRRAIIGLDKARIARIFGPPQASAGFAAVAPALLMASDKINAETWYYALDRSAREALVVQFDNGVARDAQLLRTPLPR